MVALAKNVHLDNVRWAAGTDHTAMPVEVVDRIRNGDAWVGGTAPPLSGPPPPGKSNISGRDLASASSARAALGLAAAGDGLTVPANQRAGDYTLAIGDAGTAVEVTGSSPATVTVPAHASVAFPAGTVIEVVQYGTGQVTLAGAGGVTLRTASSLTTRAQYAAVSLRKRAADEWLVAGDLT